MFSRQSPELLPDFREATSAEGGADAKVIQQDDGGSDLIVQLTADAKSNRVGATRGPGVCRHERGSLNAAHQQQNEKDDNDQTETAAGIITPATAMGPGRQGSDQEENQDDKKDGAHGNSDY